MLHHTVERIGRILLLCMPTVLALVFYPNLEALTTACEALPAFKAHPLETP